MTGDMEDSIIWFAEWHDDADLRAEQEEEQRQERALKLWRINEHMKERRWPHRKS